MNVLSLFDGMSCGRIALEGLGIKVDNYYASEIDKYAIQVSQANYPDIIQVGDVTELDTSTLPKIDLVMGGSPCQGFSFAGKQLAFDDPRSALFFEFVRCVKELQPKYFLLENVRMKKEYLDVISEYMGVEPIMINSALVSAQNRVRFYWTNIPGIEQPEQRGIVLRDVLETNPDKNLSKMTTKDDKSFCLTSNYHGAIAENSIERKQRTMIPADKPLHIGTAVDIKGHDQIKRVYSEDGKSPTLTTCGGGHREPKVMVDERVNKPKRVGTIKDGSQGDRIYSQDAKGITLNAQSGGTAGSGNMLVETISVDKEKKQLTIKEATKKGYTTIEDGDCFDMTFPNSKTRRGRNMKDKSNCLTAANYDYMRYEHSDEDKEVYWRKLTPVECERLQTVPDNYTNHVSNTQRYKMLGNGWTIEVITHILKNMEL